MYHSVKLITYNNNNNNNSNPIITVVKAKFSWFISVKL